MGGTTPLPPHAWQVHKCWKTCSEDGKYGLTEAVVMGQGQAILVYGRQSLGEGISLSARQCDAMFMPSGAISWVGKQAQLNANTVSLWEGQQMIAQAITK